MLRRILVPLDGSRISEASLPAALALADKTGGEVHLLTVLEMPPIFDFPEQDTPDRTQAADYLERTARRVPDAVPVTTSVRAGRVGEEIHAEESAWSADLIVMETHGRGGLSRLWMGSVADRVVRTGQRPVLLVRPQEGDPGEAAARSFEPRRVVVPIDGSPLAETALGPGTALAQAFGVPVLLVRGIPYPTDPGASYLSLNPRWHEELRRQVEDDLAGKARTLHEQGVDVESEVLITPGLAEAITDRAQGGLVAMTTRGAGRIDRMVFGSVTDKVVRIGGSPVLVIPPRPA